MFYSLCEVYNRRWEILWRWGGQKYILDNLYLHLHVLWPNIWHIPSSYSYFISLCLGRFIDFFYLMLIICPFSLHNSISLSKEKLHLETDIFSIYTVWFVHQDNTDKLIMFDHNQKNSDYYWNMNNYKEYRKDWKSKDPNLNKNTSMLSENDKNGDTKINKPGRCADMYELKQINFIHTPVILVFMLNCASCCFIVMECLVELEQTVSHCLSNMTRTTGNQTLCLPVPC